MMKRFLIGILILLYAFSAYTQNSADTLAVGETADCESVARNSTSWIMYFYSKGDFDSATIVLDNWQIACGLSEPILRTRILFDICNGTFSENMYDSTIVDVLLNYMLRMDTTSLRNLYSRYPENFGFVPLRSDFDYFTQSIADSLLLRAFYDPAELFFSEFYANVLPDPVKVIFKDSDFDSTLIKSYYAQRVKKFLKKPDFHLGLYSGIWIPGGNAALLGNHPVIGIQVGVRSQNKMIYNLSIESKFSKPKNEYTILRDGIIDTSNRFGGVYLGVDVEREILKLRKNTISLLAGIGYDGFDAIKVNTEDDDLNNDNSHMISSVNTNFGLAYRHYFLKSTYFGFQGKYNIVNYSNRGGTNFAGNTLTISLSIGGFFNENKSYNLKKLRYFEE